MQANEESENVIRKCTNADFFCKILTMRFPLSPLPSPSRSLLCCCCCTRAVCCLFRLMTLESRPPCRLPSPSHPVIIKKLEHGGQNEKRKGNDNEIRIIDHHQQQRQRQDTN